MPTNLPPEYYEVEQLYNEAETIEEKISTLEELISTIPKHKGTDKLRAGFRRRLSKLKSSAQSRKRTSKSYSAYHIDKEGGGQVVIVGPSNVGKSALVATLTNANPEVSDTPHTTWKPTPGMMLIDNVQVQLIDTPPLTKEFIEPEMLNLLRRADMLLVVLDVQTYPVQQLEETIEILAENRIIPQHLRADHEEQQRNVFVPVLVLANKCDDESCDEVYDIFCELVEGDWPILPISVSSAKNFDQLKQRIFDQLEIMRVYTKAPGLEPDFSQPFVLKKGSTVTELASKIHKDFYDNLKSARVWGSSAFEGQMVQRDYVLQEGDVVELRI